MTVQSRASFRHEIVSEVANGNVPIPEKLGDIRDQFRKELGSTLLAKQQRDVSLLLYNKSYLACTQKNTRVENFWQKSRPLFCSWILPDVCAIWVP
jgi:hypothetical protein